MKTILSPLLFFFLCTIGYAQKGAPDFAVTDIYGHTHKLYSDYLDKNTYVFIDFFSKDCQPCRDLAPVVDTVFREFGCNYGDIAFLGLEVASDDSSLWDFTRELNIGYPIAGGVEGGAHEVFDIYGYYYTPYTIIISPDKVVISDDPSFSNAEKMRDSLLQMGFSMQLCSGNDFIFYSANSNNDSVVAEIDSDNRQINIPMPVGTDLTQIRPTFVNAVNSTVEIDGILQISGITILDFSIGPIIYTVTSETGIQQDWQVIVNMEEGVEFLKSRIHIYPNPSKEILYFENTTPEPYGKISVTDINGKTVFERTSTNSVECIDLQNFEQGIYILEYTNRFGSIREKILRQ
jgi:thiol-disulfide isomerase/thioredoxin